jgi:hypothetical protein
MRIIYDDQFRPILVKSFRRSLDQQQSHASFACGEKNAASPGNAWQRGLDEKFHSKEGVSHDYGSSRKVRIRKGRTGRSGSVSRTAGGSFVWAGFFSSILAKRSRTSAGWISSRWRSPTDAHVPLDESLRFGVCVHALLRPGCVRESAALALAPALSAPRPSKPRK